MSNIKKEFKDKANTICKKCFGRPHHRAVWWIVLVFLISGFLSFVTFKPSPAMSAILASICAGCITGIAFYVITNLRNNEIRATSEEYKSIEEHIALTKDAEHLGMRIIESVEKDEDYRSELGNLKKLTDKLTAYMGTMFIDSPKTTKLIKDFPADYSEKVESLSAAFEHLESENEEPGKDKTILCLLTIIQFCVATRGILLEPMIELMKDVWSLEKSVL